MLATELDRMGFVPSPFEVVQGQGLIIPSRQAFWYKYSKENDVSNDDPLILTLDQLETIREQTEEVLHQDFAIYQTNYKQIERLNWVYLNAMEQGGISILSLFDQDSRLLKKSIPFH